MGRHRKFTDDQLRDVLARGLTHAEAARELNVHLNSVQQHARRLGLGTRSEMHQAEVVRLGRAGLFGHEIAAQLGIPYQTVMRYARQNGVKLARPGTGPQNDERSDDFRRRYLSGETLQQIGDAYGVSRERVRQVLSRQYGITARDGGYSIIRAEKKQKRRAAQDAKCQAKYGCSYRNYLSVVREERRMMREGAGADQLPRRAFGRQRTNAKARGISWELTFWEWWVIWQESGKWSRRGKRADGFCMCRKGDVGPYSKDNVYIATIAENASVANKKSGLPLGVILTNGRYEVRRRLNGKNFYLGRFDTPEEAHLAFVRFRGLEAAE